MDEFEYSYEFDAWATSVFKDYYKNKCFFESCGEDTTDGKKIDDEDLKVDKKDYSETFDGYKFTGELRPAYVYPQYEMEYKRGEKE